MKRLLLFLCLAVTAEAFDHKVILTSANTSPWTIDATYNPADNKIEIVGAGGAGSARVSSSQGGNGGGGGAYAVKTSVDLGTGTAAFQISAVQNPTWIKNSSGTIQVQADYGRSATAVNLGHGAGGAAAACTPSAGAQSGGNGGDSVVADAGAGGGGSGGPNGAGGNGASGATINGGTADGATVGQQTTQGAIGNSGTEWTTEGCGGGGAGGVGGGSRAGGAGGLRGGGGGGADSGTAAGGGVSQGLIVIQWTATVAPNTGFLQMFSRKENKPCLNNYSSLSRWQLVQLLALLRSTLPPSRMH